MLDLDELERLAKKPIRTMDELIILAYAVPELVARVRELERQREWLAQKASEQYAELYKYKNSILAPVCYTSAAQWKYFAEEAAKEAENAE